MKNVLEKRILEIEDVKNIKPTYEILKVINKSIAQKTQTLFFDFNKNTIFLLTTNAYPQMIDKILEKFPEKQYKFERYYTDEKGFAIALSWYDQMHDEADLLRKQLHEKQSVVGLQAEAMIQKTYDERKAYSEGDFMENLIRLAFQSGSSDLHFQPEEIGVVMRIRKDGVLKKILTFSHQEFRKYLIKLKFMSGVRINIDFMPQDGRFDFKTIRFGQTTKIDVRVSFMPGLRGDSIVMRYLDSTRSIMTFGDIGFDQDSTDVLLRNLNKNYGMILLTGPTGSGKTTTLYSMLHYLNDPGKKIITLEDPVEYEIPGLDQSQINEKKGYTYNEGLKSILRQDPDIIMVGEIRDAETAEIAVNAALTGHLVLSTLHTNSAIEAVSRLLNLGVKPYMLGPALNLVIGQRLVRKVHTCKANKPASLAEAKEIESVMQTIKNISPHKVMNFDGNLPYSMGCEGCGDDGYKGRVAVVETFELNDNSRKYIIEGKSTLDIYGLARQQGYLTMNEDGYLKVLNGFTTLSEIRRVL